MFKKLRTRLFGFKKADVYGYIAEMDENASEQLAKKDEEIAELKAKITKFENKIKELEKNKPVIFCGDLNVAHKEIDLKNPKSNMNNAGFTKEERGKMTALLDSGFIDTFRHFHPDEEGAYSWWSYMFHAREKNVGWRIDYFIASEALKDRLQGACIHPEIMGSDHCPVEVVISE